MPTLWRPRENQGLAVVEDDHERGVWIELPDAGEQASGGRRIEAFGRLVS
jgi:hypothetical protein